MYKLDLEKTEEPEIKFPTFTGSWRKQGNYRKTPTPTSLTVLKSLTMWITIYCEKFFKRSHFTLWHAHLLSHGQMFATLWTGACQAPLSIGFSRQEYWSGLPFSSPGDFSPPRDQTSVSCVSCIGRQIL